MRQSVKICFHVVFAAVMILIVTISHGYSVSRRASTNQSTPVVLIDAGHGGEDGGASAVDGTLEKDINLAIALDLRDIMTLWGVSVQMTRDTDQAIYDRDCTTMRQKKVSDMYNRLSLYDGAEITISIHQNHFSVSKYSGAQIFYSVAHPDSYTLATCVREQIIAMTQPENTRELKKATDSIFLLHRTSRPAILVECGFLSNPTENEKLKTETYQQQMAFSIVSGYLNYITSSKE